ncbi:restriction endonuclease [Spirosoma foliorum]|uniref:Restriction endonuclease n=1 Tax=Spirosoma foliorum TaxID=2710596 RepID=A0A7G5GP79_9BACT|nr:restriction endonuclease [Spirosoma foliorum]QMW00671.1 restriction endonuclease [Spirosoma foliorum]
MAKRISSDGKGLEKLVSRIYESLKDNPLIEVIHDIKLPNCIGSKSQFDVIIKNKFDDDIELIAIECKDYKGRVSISQIHDFNGRCSLVKGIGKKVFVAVNGYQSGAKELANHYNIELYNLNEISVDLLRSWIKWERSYVSYPEKRQIGAILFHAQGGKIISYNLDNLSNLSLNLVLQSPGVEPVILQSLISSMVNKDGFNRGLLQFAGEDFNKLTVSGDEKLITIPMRVQVIPEIPYVTALEGFQVQINKVEVVFEYTYKIARFEDVTARSYQTNEGKNTAHVMSTQVGEMKLEIIRNTFNGINSFYIIDSGGHMHKMNQERVKEFYE